MSAHVSAVAFDLGGVIADWNPEYVFEEMIPDPERRAQFIRKVCSPEWLESINQGCRFEIAVAQRQAEFPEFHDEIAAYLHRWGDMIAGPVDGMTLLINEVRNSGAQVFIFTNHPADTLGVTLERLPFLIEADGMFVSGFEGVTKPAPWAYQRFLSKFGLRPQNTLLVDDELENVRVALEMGWDAVLFTSAPELRGELLRRLLV